VFVTLRRLFVPLFALCATSLPAQGNGGRPALESLGTEVLREMIETNTTDQHGSTGVLARKLATRFVAAGFPAADVQVVGADTATHKNLVVRWRGAGTQRPILLLAHLDVVEARREDWSVDPFTLVEKDGFYYGRGTMDVKGGGATLVTSLLRLKSEGFAPTRDIILALTAGEESGNSNGVEWLLANRRDLIGAAYVVNVDGGGGVLRHGVPAEFHVQAAEKVYQSFTLTARDRGGHSSVPQPGNPIYRLARALERVERYQFPATLNPVTRDFFSNDAPLVGGPDGDAMRRFAANPRDTAAAATLSKDLVYNALIRTTCVATMLEGGHAENALPQLARATVNCRMMPGSSPDSVRATIQRVVGDTGVAVAFVGQATPSGPTAMTPDVAAALRRVVTAMWGQIPILQVMETGATDGLFLRNVGIPVYGVTGVFSDNEDDRAHGRDERIGVAQYRDALTFMHRLVRELAGK
jgi:acetylornithine deacetylase/succinyl-diaminopimelate desuccinylase-like protein